MEVEWSKRASEVEGDGKGCREMEREGRIVEEVKEGEMRGIEI
jgi:hypothetical protein